MNLQIPAPENDQIVYADVQKNRYSGGYSLIVKKCRFCKTEHVHSGEEGHRSAHCFDRRTGRAIPITGYTLKADWSKPKNRKLQEEYMAFYRLTANES